MLSKLQGVIKGIAMLSKQGTTRGAAMSNKECQTRNVKQGTLINNY
jgi:hypothetical protein